MITNRRKFRIITAYETHVHKYDEYKKDMLHAMHRIKNSKLFGFTVMSCEERDKYNSMLRTAKRRMKRQLEFMHRLEMLYPDLCMR